MTKLIVAVALSLSLSGCAGMGCLNPWTTLSDCGNKHGVWPVR